MMSTVTTSRLGEQFHLQGKNYFKPNFLINRVDLASKSIAFESQGLRKVVLWLHLP